MSTDWISGLLVNQLKEELKKRQLPISGKKAELQERLVTAVLAEDGGGPVDAADEAAQPDGDLVEVADEPSAPVSAGDDAATTATPVGGPLPAKSRRSSEHAPSSSSRPDGVAGAARTQPEPQRASASEEPLGTSRTVVVVDPPAASVPAAASVADTAPAKPLSPPAADGMVESLLGMEEPLDYDEDDLVATDPAPPPAAVASAVVSPAPVKSSPGEQHVDTPHPASKQGRAAVAREREAAPTAVKRDAPAAVGQAARDGAAATAVAAAAVAAAASIAVAAPDSVAAPTEPAADGANDRKRKHAPIPNFAPREALQVTENGKGSTGRGSKVSQDGKGVAVTDSSQAAKVSHAAGSKAGVASTKGSAAAAPTPPADQAGPLADKRAPAGSAAQDSSGPAELASVSGGTVVPGMSALRVDNLVRPFTEKGLRELMSKFGTVISLWLECLKRHCVVTFETDEQAAAAFAALDGLQWPPASPKRLQPTHLTPEQAAEVIADKAAPAGAPKAPVLAPRAAAAAALAAKDQAAGLTHPADVTAPRRLREGPEAVRREAAALPAAAAAADPAAAMHQEAVIDLAQLFKKTATKPCIFWLPLSDDQAAAARTKAAAEAKGEAAHGKKAAGGSRQEAPEIKETRVTEVKEVGAAEHKRVAAEPDVSDARREKKSRGEAERPAKRR